MVRMSLEVKKLFIKGEKKKPKQKRKKEKNPSIEYTAVTSYSLFIYEPPQNHNVALSVPLIMR